MTGARWGVRTVVLPGLRPRTKCAMDLLKTFSVGMLVRQKCGGPEMSVVSIDEKHVCFPADIAPLGGVFCVWADSSTLYGHVFSPYALDVINGFADNLEEGDRRALPRRL